MSIRRNHHVWLALTVIVIGITAYGFSSRRLSQTPQNRVGAKALRNDQFVRMSSLEPRLRPALQALGDRIQKPGKERMILMGTMQIANGETTPIALNLQFPDRLRLEEQGIGPRRLLTFDSSTPGRAGNSLDQTDRDIIETLVYDTAEHFFLTQANGSATRLLGLRFRADDGTAPNYSGPYYDLYEVSDLVSTKSEPQVQSKYYSINSTTLLPERVQYQVQRNGSPVQVEIRLSEWQETVGQILARRIVRLENNQPAITLTITSVAFAGKADDGMYR